MQFDWRHGRPTEKLDVGSPHPFFLGAGAGVVTEMLDKLEWTLQLVRLDPIVFHHFGPDINLLVDKHSS